jgi:aryl-alcohol dehydrogenase-like predicted oxidoreductase
VREASDIFLKALFRSKDVESDKEIVVRVEELAKQKGVSMAQIATSWVVGQGGMAPICGLETKERIDQAVQALQLTLTEEDCKYLEEPYVPKQIVGY